MSNKKTVVVGSGIAGITAAYFEQKKGSEVTLIDSASSAGGLLKSTRNGKNYFDYGTHILPETGVEELDEFLFSELNPENCVITKNIAASNYFNGQMNEKSCYVDTSVLSKEEYNQGCVELLSTKLNGDEDNLEKFLKNKMGETFYQQIYRGVIEKFMGVSVDQLDNRVGSFFDTTRLLAFDNATTKRLIELDIYNSKLGHHIREDGVVKYYPRQGGVGKIIELLMDKIEKQGVVFKHSAKMQSISQTDGRISNITLEDGALETDKVIWTLPSGFLLHLSGMESKSQPPKFRNTALYDFTFEKPLNSAATFINIYDTELLSGRISLYQNLSQTNNYSCTVEVLADDDMDLPGSLDLILHELRQMKLADANNDCTFKQFRPVENGFPVLTTEFAKAQKGLNGFCGEYFKNATFIGRSSGNAFFMHDVLVDTYKKIVEGDV